MKDIRYYLSLPWHVQRTAHSDDGEYTSLTIEELPDFVVAARTDKELEEMFWLALEAFLLTYLQDNEEPPIPPRVREREERLSQTREALRLVEGSQGGTRLEIQEPESLSFGNGEAQYLGRELQTA
jgi:hypothetical protein